MPGRKQRRPCPDCDGLREWGSIRCRACYEKLVKQKTEELRAAGELQGHTRAELLLAHPWMQIGPRERWALPYKCRRCAKPTIVGNSLCFGCATGRPRVTISKWDKAQQDVP